MSTRRNELPIDRPADRTATGATAHSAAGFLGEMLRRRIEELFPRYPSRRAVVLPGLHLINEALGYVPVAAVDELAEMLGLTPAQVEDTLSFYGFFRQDRPLGRLRIMVCRSISCSACGGEELLDHLCRRLGIRPGETTADGRFTVEFAECLGLCDMAPALLAGDQVHGNLTEEKLDQLIDGWMRTVEAAPANAKSTEAEGISPSAARPLAGHSPDS